MIDTEHLYTNKNVTHILVFPATLSQLGESYDIAVRFTRTAMETISQGDILRTQG